MYTFIEDSEFSQLLGDSVYVADTYLWIVGDSPYWKTPFDDHFSKTLENLTSWIAGQTVIDLGGCSELVNHLYTDEWSYFVAIPGEHIGKVNLSKVANLHCDPEDIFREYPDKGIVWFCYVDGYWEVRGEDIEVLISDSLVTVSSESSRWFSESFNECEVNRAVDELIRLTKENKPLHLTPDLPL